MNQEILNEELPKAASNKLVSLLQKQLKEALAESERLYQENTILKEELRND